ncbi:MAG: AtpZ/AtpI family protein [Desulfobulbaceae bacterium]|nr:MAG: AtpZ/AtpI family protein [Desulfobulbaceae bacterium]
MAGERQEVWKLLAVFSTVGMTVVFSVFIGLGVGYLLDHKLFDGRTAPWFTLIFLALGVVAAFKNLYALSQRKDL